MLKGIFTREWPGPDAQPGRSRESRRERPVWQRRYWEHFIRNEVDLRRHVEYIHFNPVKHDYVHAPRDWEFSTFHKYVIEQLYEPDWGSMEPGSLRGLDAVGE